MNDKGIIAVWSDDLKLTRKLFKDEFNAISEREDNHGLYTFFICSYNEFKVSIEIVYSLVYEKTCLFAYSTKSLTVFLNEKLEIINSKIVNDHKSHFLDSVYFNENDLEYIGDSCDSVGNLYGLFTIPYENPYHTIVDMLNREHVDFDGICIAESHLLDMAIEFTEYIQETFQHKIDEAIQNDSTDGIESNPFANRFYDRNEDKTPILNKPQRLG